MTMTDARRPGAMPGIQIDPLRCGGRPVLAGTRFTLSQLVAQIAWGVSPQQVADDFDLDPETVTAALNSLALFLDRDGVPLWEVPGA